MPSNATALQEGNRALRSGRADQAIRHDALALAEADQPTAPGSSTHPADLVHLVKPRWPNILFGLLYQLLWDARVLVDLDDDELAFVQGEPLPDLASHSAEPVLEHWLQRHDGLPAWSNLPGRPWTELGMSLCHAFDGRFDGLTVANRALQQRRGGTIIRHARAPAQFRPAAACPCTRRANRQPTPQKVTDGQSGCLIKQAKTSNRANPSCQPGQQYSMPAPSWCRTRVAWWSQHA